MDHSTVGSSEEGVRRDDRDGAGEVHIVNEESETRKRSVKMRTNEDCNVPAFFPSRFLTSFIPEA